MHADTNTLILLAICAAWVFFSRIGARSLDNERLDRLERKLDRILAQFGVQEGLPNRNSGLNELEKNLLRQGQKIQAIKQVRERTGLGLKEAKDVVDEAELLLRNSSLR